MWSPKGVGGVTLCLKRIGVPPSTRLLSMALWPLKELGCPSTCAEVAQGSQSYHGIGVPQDTKEMWGPCSLRDRSVPPAPRDPWHPAPLRKGLEVPPCTGVTWRPQGPHPVPSGNCSVPTKERWGPSLLALSYLGMGCVGSPCLSSMGLEVLQGLGVHGVTYPYTPMELWSP